MSIPYVKFTLPKRDPWLYNTPFTLRIEATSDTHTLPATDGIEVSVYDTCFDTVVTPQNIVQLTTFVNAPLAITRPFNPFTDLVAEKYSGEYGDGSGYDLCGPQTYDMREIINNKVEPSDIVTIDSTNRILSLQTNDPADTGLHDMLLCVTLVNFSVEYCQPFAALVSNCDVTNLVLTPAEPPGTEITCQIGNNAAMCVVPTPTPIYTPTECMYDLIMEARIFGSNDPLPSFITFSQEQGIQIKSSDPNDKGIYQVELTATVDGPSNAGEVDVLYTITLERCQLDRVTQSLPIPDSIVYSIGSGPLPIDTNVSNLFDECPLLCELEMQEDF